MSGSSEYDVISVNWNQPQTDMWLYYLEKHCPTANVILIGDDKPIPWNWSSGKINCFKYDFPHPDRVIYMDTDTIVTADLEPLFDKYNAHLSASIFIPTMSPLHPNKRSVNKRKIAKCDQAFRLRKTPRHWSTGFLLFKGFPLKILYDRWLAAMEYPPLVAAFKTTRIYEELVFSYVIEHMTKAGVKLEELPHEIHGNILGGKADFGTCKEKEVPMVIHYHKTYRLRQVGLEHLDVSIETT